MRIPTKFIAKHARPGETMPEARKRLMAAFLRMLGTKETPEDGLRRFDKLLESDKRRRSQEERRHWDF